MIIAINSVSAFALSLVLTWLVRTYAIKREIVDVPNSRSSHKIATPRGGGLAAVISFCMGMAVLAWFDVISLRVFAALVGSGLLAAMVGFADDHSSMRARWRLVVHFAAAAWLIAWLGGVGAVDIGAWRVGVGPVGTVFFILMLVWLLNLYNFMDGIDAIASAEALFILAAGGAFFWAGGESPSLAIALLLFASVAGFLFWNLPPARIFMGDVGSGFVGLTLGAIAIIGIRSEAVPFWTWFILFGCFTVDATVTLFKRAARGAKWYEAHCDHAYQHAARRCGSHGRVTAVVTAINLLWLLPFAWASWNWREYGPAFAFASIAPLVWLALRLGAGRSHREALESGNASALIPAGGLGDVGLENR